MKVSVKDEMLVFVSSFQCVAQKGCTIQRGVPNTKFGNHLKSVVFMFDVGPEYIHMCKIFSLIPSKKPVTREN